MPGREDLDLADRVEDHRVGRLLGAECGRLGDDREQLAAVVVVAAQLGPRQRALAGLAALPAGQQLLRGLRHLVHVDDVGERPQPVQGLEAAPPPDAGRDGDEEEDGDGREDDVVDAALDVLQPVDRPRGTDLRGAGPDRRHDGERG